VSIFLARELTHLIEGMLSESKTMRKLHAIQLGVSTSLLQQKLLSGRHGRNIGIGWLKALNILNASSYASSYASSSI